MTNKTPAHLVSENAVKTAQDRITAARTAEFEARARIRAATTSKETLLASAAAGEAVTAQQVREAEEEARDAEIQLQFATAALRGTQEAQVKAVADLRPHEQEFFKRSHRELIEQQAQIAREADELLTAALAKLAEYDDAQREFHALRQAADASLAAPLWPTTTINSSRDPLPLPPTRHKIDIKITKQINGFETQFQSFQHVLGHGRPAVAA